MRLLQRQQGCSMSWMLHPVLGWGSQDQLCPRIAPSQAMDSSSQLSPGTSSCPRTPWSCFHPVGVKLLSPVPFPLFPLRETFHGLAGRCKRSFGCQVIKPGNYQCRAPGWAAG